ncbi:MAG: hypothetical protein Q4E78_02225 [Eubacteriales bacterium]|nr:hypothetical protein [Eubacteriales bacterium]
MSKVLYSVYRYIVLGLFLVINIWLFLLSIFSTSRLTSDASERTYYTGDHAWLHVIILAILIAAVFYLVRKNIFTRINSYLTNNEKAFIRIRNICLIIIGISGAAWVLLTQSTAGADQYYVLNAARGLRNGDYSAFQYNGYIAKYTNQIGLLFIEYIIGFIVGDYNYLFWQLLNVVMIVFTYKMFSDILGLLKLPRIASLFTIILGILFFPWTLYSVFIYGNVAGLFFATASFKYTILFIDRLKEFNSLKISYIVISAVSMMLSVMVKNNYLIFMIALIIYTIAETLRHQNIQIILVTCAVIAGFAIQAVVPKLVVEKISGCNLNNGASSWTWIAMGLHPSDSNVYADGWYSGRIAAFYENNDYDTRKEAEASKAEIKGYIDTYKSDHSAFVSFLSKKVASQWNNPEFQCFWITNVRGSNIEKSVIISEILSLEGSTPFIAFLNIMQSIILFGSMLYAINALIGGTFAGATVLPLTFIGGFIFHLFWEGKCQYTLPYFMLLLPLSIIGFYSMAKRLAHVTAKHLYKCGVFAVILLFITIIFNRFTILNQDDKSYKQYREYTIEQQKL